ncbi:MAG: hypothetical protein HPY53_09580 [Brevinematales bacterium]|nr:hypothetical protein [Brevinematales bacterium]
MNKNIITFIFILGFLINCGGPTYINNNISIYDPASISGPQQIASPDWRDETIYFIMIDRFANGNPNNDIQMPGGAEHGPTEYQWNGGDFQGLIQKLEYIKELGFTAIWITPPIENEWWDASIPYAGYHGYWASVFTNVDPHYGTMEEYKAFVRLCHLNGIKVIQDIVCNHTGNYFKMDSVNGNITVNSNSYPMYPAEKYLSNSIVYYIQNGVSSSNEVSFYHWTPDITDWNDWVQLTNYQASSLDDLNSENPFVLKKLKEWYNYWIANVGIDGVRMDTAKNVPKDFWKDFCFSSNTTDPGMRYYANGFLKTNFIMFGEVWTPGAANEDQLAGGFTQDELGNPVMHDILYYPLNSAVKAVFAQGKPTENIKILCDNITNYRSDIRSILVSFIDNHDTQRFISASDIVRMKMALVFIYTYPGIPCVYYGTEQAFTEQRAAMFADGFQGGMEKKDYYDTSSDTFKFVKNLNSLRKAFDILRYGNVQIVKYDSLNSGILAYIREYNAKKILVIFNTSSITKYANGIDTGYLGINTFINLLSVGTNESINSFSDGKIYTSIAPYTVKVLILNTNFIEYR